MSADEPNHCGKCDYELTGLALVGNCPECGQAYSLWSAKDGHANANQFVSGTADRRLWLVRHTRSGLLAIAAVLVLFCSGLIFYMANQNRYVLAAGVLLTFLMLLGAVISYLFERSD